MLPETWVGLAEHLLSRDDQTEVDWRSATHACYYAVYHTAATDLGRDPAGADAGHAEIQDLLLGLPIPPARSKRIMAARVVYRELKQLRVKADYHLKQSFTADEADRALQLAQKVLPTR